MEIVTHIQRILESYFETISEHLICSSEHITIIVEETKLVAIDLLNAVSAVDFQNFM